MASMATKRQRQAKPRESLHTAAFDSAGPKKFALQLQRAANGNPCLRVVQGSPQDDGTYRKFDITIWSEDWPAFFQAMDEIREYIEENDLRTPDGHNWRPKARTTRRS